MLCRALLNMVLPLHGAQTMSILCNHDAAIHSALFAMICHFMFSKSCSVFIMLLFRVWISFALQIGVISDSQHKKFTMSIKFSKG